MVSLPHTAQLILISKIPDLVSLQHPEGRAPWLSHALTSWGMLLLSNLLVHEPWEYWGDRSSLKVLEKIHVPGPKGA